jgi:hypothetical protein
MTWTPQQDFTGQPGDPINDPEVQALAKVIAAVIHPSYKQIDSVRHRKAIAAAVAVLKAGYRQVEVTDEMVRRAVTAHKAPRLHVNDSAIDREIDMRAALEAVLGNG